MTDDVFKLPQSSYDELVKIIRAYGHFTEPVELAAIGQASALHSTIVSRNNGFLLAVNVLEGGQRKVLTTIGRRLARALDHNIEDEIASNWRDVILSNDFLQKILSAIRIRSGMEPSSLQSHIAYSAGLNKTSGVMTGTRTVIDIMTLAGVLIEADGKLQVALIDANVAPSGFEADLTDPPREERVVGSVLVPSTPYPAARVTRTRIGNPETNPHVAINIEVRIQCTPAEVEGLGGKLRAMLADLANRAGDGAAE